MVQAGGTVPLGEEVGEGLEILTILPLVCLEGDSDEEGLLVLAATLVLGMGLATHVPLFYATLQEPAR